MAYQSLYRKYRPQTFSDVVGQGHVVRTLQNALASGRIAHGYLFTGTRGTAKTTVARLVAKALNCESAGHPVAEPCNQCDACRSITAGTSVDVIEMDAASHRGVQDIEEVRRAVGYGPMQLRYKVFIIDEAHQLSSDAKDAFLKTLEEPPANVVFILATTEPQAIPITIRSRCQQFDFKRGSIAEITSRLCYVLDCEGVAYTPEAVTLVARGAEGSYRDSLSLLEQVLAFSPKQITAPDVEMVLGSLDAEMLSKVVYAVSERNAPETFALAGQILDSGKEARTLLRTMSLHFRDLLLVSVGGPAVAVEMTPDEVQRLQGEARLFSPQQMMKAMDILNEAQGETRWNNQHRLLTELTFLKLMNLGDGQGEGREFVTAPITFSAAQVATATLPASKIPVVPQVITPAPIPEVVSVPAPVVIAPPVAEAKTEPEPEIVTAPIEIPTPTAEEVGLEESFFADDTPADDDAIEYEPDSDSTITTTAADIDPMVTVAESTAPVAVTLDDDNGFAPIGDDDAPFSDETVEALVAAPVKNLLAEQEKSPEDDLFADTPQEGPGLFDDPAPTPAVVAKTETKAETAPPPEPPPTPPPAEEKSGATEDALFPTSRERNQHPPALSLENVEEVRPIATPAAAVPAASSTSELEPTGPPVTLGQVHAVWNRFLDQTERISRGTWILMREARVNQVNGSAVIITLYSRASYEMLEENPKAIAFIKKLLARVLGREAVGVRLELDPTQAIPPRRRRVAESRDPKKRYDRLAAIDALDLNAPSYQPGSSGGGFSGGNSGFGYSGGARQQPAPVAAPVPSSSFGNFATAPLQRERPSYAPSSVPDAPPMGAGSPESFPPSTNEKRAIAMAEPLVQDVLVLFGGEVIID